MADPAAVDLSEPKHPSFRDQSLRRHLIYLRPLAVRLARGKVDQPALCVSLRELPVDPAEIQREFDRFGLCRAGDRGTLLGEPELGSDSIAALSLS